MNILMLYDYSLSFHDNEKMPLAGTQTAFIELAKAFVSIGCKVTALTSSKEIYKRDNLYWGNLDDQQENIKGISEQRSTSNDSGKAERGRS